MREIFFQLQEIGAVKFGSFILKSGLESPVYIDLRRIVSYPNLLKVIAESIWKKAENLSFDRICGVPYTALPIASCLSITHNIPMVLRRKEAKNYGTKQMVEGVFDAGQRCLVIEDLITSGSSIFETIATLEGAGMKVEDIIVFLDREQGGRQRLEDKGYRLHAVTTLSALFKTLNIDGDALCLKSCH